jgi:uncharacterized protein DUF2784
MKLVNLILAEFMLAAHLAYILWVIFGALVARRRWAQVLHIASLVYAIAIELGPWPCLLTLAENFFEARAGLVPYRGPFLLHYLDLIVYPNLSATLLTWAGVAVCVANLLLYSWKFRRGARREDSD